MLSLIFIPKTAHCSLELSENYFSLSLYLLQSSQKKFHLLLPETGGIYNSLPPLNKIHSLRFWGKKGLTQDLNLGWNSVLGWLLIKKFSEVLIAPFLYSVLRQLYCFLLGGKGTNSCLLFSESIVHLFLSFMNHGHPVLPKLTLGLACRFLISHL